MKFINNEENNNTTNELDVNRKNREDYEKLMKESSTNLDNYWDRNNIFVRFILLVLAAIIILGVIYYALAYFG
jgi:hypothetical protein